MNKPFVGIAPYRESDSAIFFGRDDDARVILANLRASRLTILYGESGAGKSSLLNARVVPHLREEDGFPTVTFAAWSTDPAGQIRRAIASALGDESAGEGTLADCILERTTLIKGRLLLVLDQFEEYFQYRARQPDPFLDQLSELVVSEDVPVNVLIAIREDALSSLDVFQDSIPQLFDNYLRLEHLSRKSAREAIEGPIAAYAEATGRPIRLEDGLPDAVIESISGKTERVPGIYLQLVMSELWDHDSAAGFLRITTLERLGGAHRIFEAHFGTTIQEHLTEPERAIAERMFTSLVTASGRKQVQTLNELGGADQGTHAVLEKLRNARILAKVPVPLGAPPDEQAAYEFVHDVLARAALEWRTARSLELERRKAAMERRTAQKLRMLAWALFAALVVALISGVVTFFALQDSELLSENEIARQDADKRSIRIWKGFLETRQKTIEAEALAQSQIRSIEADARTASERADVEAANRRAANLVLHGKRVLDRSDPENQAALALAMHAVRGLLTVGQPVSADAEDLLRDAAAANSMIMIDPFKGLGSGENRGDITWSPDGRKLYVPTIAGVATSAGKILRRNVAAAAWDRAGRLAFANEGAPAVVTLIEEKASKILGTRELTGMRSYTPVQWNSNLTKIIAQSEKQSSDSAYGLAIWSLDDDRPPVEVHPFKYWLSKYDWSPDGTLILAQGYDSRPSDGILSLKILQPSSGEAVATLPSIEGAHRSRQDVFVTWTPDSRQIAVSKAGRVDIFDSQTGRHQRSFEVGATPGPIAFHPRNSRYLALTRPDAVEVWDSERKRSTIFRTSETAKRISWSPDGTMLAVLSQIKDERWAVALYGTDIAFWPTLPELLKAARRYLKKDFRFSESECRQYFESPECPALPWTFSP